MYRINDWITGEILESKYKYVVFEEAHKRMEEYKEKYGKEFYLDFIGSATWDLKEYKPKED
jgi:hypothetical protein